MAYGCKMLVLIYAPDECICLNIVVVCCRFDNYLALHGSITAANTLFQVINIYTGFRESYDKYEHMIT